MTGFLSPSDTQDYQMFGYSVCIHNNTIVVGAYGDSTAGSNTGAVYIFRKMLSNSQPHRGRAVSASNMTVLLYEWVEIQKLLPGILNTLTLIILSSYVKCTCIILL
jgi:hypothetical protein